MLNIVLFGPPGAGKGTQSNKLTDHYKLIHLSTGDLLRSETKAGTPLGLEAKSLIDAGKLVPDEIVVEMIRKKLFDNRGANGFIFDGFPRTTEQAQALDGLLLEMDESITLMLALDVPEEELIKRLLERGKESGRADDQNEEVIKKRLQVYKQETMVLKDYYQKQNKFHNIDGLGSIQEIFTRLGDVINKVSTTL